MTTTSVAIAILVTVFAVRGWNYFRAGNLAVANPVMFFLLVFVSMLMLRLPFIEYPRELNVDESQMLAQGMRFVSHPIPWRDVDGTTSGPLNSLILSAVMRLGMPATWATARLVHFGLICLTLVFLYLTLRLIGTRLEAQLSLAPTVFFYAFAIYPDFSHYSSETLPVLLLAACFYLLAKEWLGKAASPARLFWLGLLLGSVPFAKLQAAPLALLLTATVFLIIGNRHFKQLPGAGKWWKEVLSVTLGGVIVPSLLLGVVSAKGAFNDFWVSYIQANAAYVQEETIAKRLRSVYLLICGPSDFNVLLTNAMGAVGIILIFRLVQKTKLTFEVAVPLVLLAIYSALGVFCVLVAGKCFGHHFLLLVPALAICFGLLLINGRTRLKEDRAARRPDLHSRGNCGFWLLCLLTLGFQLCGLRAYLNTAQRNMRQNMVAKHSAVAERLLEARRPGDTLSVWGWVPSYYVETGLIPATRDAIGHRVISPGPLQEYFKQRHLRDLMRSKPAIFVDAISTSISTWNWTANDRHESFPALAEVIARVYVLWESVSVKDLEPVRIYLSKSRMAELTQPQTEFTARHSEAK